ncbi:MAG TPA: Tn3 family transposase, partial [Inquilinus sp.]
MRHPGRVLRADEAPPRALVAYVADQLGLRPHDFAAYARREETRLEHGRLLQQYLHVRLPTAEDRRAALVAAIDAAAATDRGEAIAQAVVDVLRKRHALLLSAREIDRIGRAGRAIARGRANAALIEGLSPEQLATLDALLVAEPAIRQTRFGWLRSCPEAPGAHNLSGLIERVAFVRALGIDPTRRERIHPDRFKQMVREGEVTPSWLAADFNAGRRRATIVAQLIALGEALTDAAVAMFVKLIGRLFSRAATEKKQRHSDARKETSRALRLFRDTLRALVMANGSDHDVFEVLDAEVGWHRLIQSQPTVEALVVDSDPAPLLIAAEHYAGVRKYAPQFLDAFIFRSSRRDPLLTAIEMLRLLNREGRRLLPDKAPVGHLRDNAVRKLVFVNGKLDRRRYEIATLAVLRDRLRSGDVWVEGSRAFRPIDDHLLPKVEFAARKEADDLALGVPHDADAYLDAMRDEIDFNLKRLAWRASNGQLDGVRLVDGELVVTPLASEVPAEAEALKQEMHPFLPLIDVPDLLGEVNDRTGFAACFTHLRTQEPVRSTAAVLAAILADASNLGPRRMAGTSIGVSERQIIWARLFHLRSETYKAGQAVITNAQTLHPYAQLWGSGRTSSSDGQFFRAGDRAAARSDVNKHYGAEPGGKIYSHLSDQYGYYSALPLSPSESEAPYVLDGILDHETVLDIEEHFTDTGGSSDHVFGLFVLIGRRFAPRLRDLKGRQFHPLGKAEAYPALKRHMGPPINVALIREYWDELLRLALSLNMKTVAPSTILRKLAASKNPSQLARALRELGRLERTRFMIGWYSDPALRRRCQAGLNKGEAAHKLKRAIFIHERGEIRDRSFDSQAFRASGLNLVAGAIIHWNTIYLARVAEHLRALGRDIPDDLLRHVSPLTWEHVNLTGTYSWAARPLDPGAFRPLRQPRSAFRFVA